MSRRTRVVLPALVLASCLADADPIETGDAGSESSADATTGAPADALVVFVTSQPVTGGFGGPDLADGICLEHATDAALPGTYRAWLSSITVTAAERIGVTERPYVLTDFATVVASGTMDIYDGFLEHAIDLDEHGQPAPASTAGCTSLDGPVVWTGSSDIGDWSGNDCVGWTVATGDGGTVGVIAPGQLDVTWTNGCTIPCESSALLYCFQLPD